MSLSIFALIVTLVLLLALFPRIDSETDINRLNLPVLGKIPELRRLPFGSEDSSLMGIEHLKIMNYRILRETKDIKCPIVLITSARAREGKSTVSQLLALASEGPDRKTLLIDGDLLTAHPNRFFGVPEDQTPGLRCLLNPNPPDVESLIVRTAHEGVSFLPRGERLGPSVSSPNFLRPIEIALQSLRQKYDLILIDTPPLFASNLSHQWAGLANLIVVVGRLFVTRPNDLTEALQTCRIFSKAPVGVALNCVPLSVVDRRVSNYYFSSRKKPPSKMAA